MRIALLQDQFDLEPGAILELVIEVFNTRTVIDGVSASIVGFEGAVVECHPSELALFPETSGLLHVVATVPPGFPAGLHELEVEVRSSVPGGDVARSAFALTVGPSRKVLVELEPAQVEGRKARELLVRVVNRGNVTAALSLEATDPQGILQFDFARPLVDLPPGGSDLVPLVVRSPRRLFGGKVALPFGIEARDTDAPADPASGERPEPAEASGVYVHKPVIAAGLVTAAILAGIVALWALAMVFGLLMVQGRDPVAKTVPVPGFYASNVALQTQINPPGTVPGGAPAPPGPPAGTLPKTGSARGIGGTILGTVTAKSTGQPVGRITVQAVHVTTDGSEQIAAAAASADDGTYKLDGLLPGPYFVRFQGTGFEVGWYPAATDRSGASPVPVLALQEKPGIDAVVDGQPGAIAGTVDTGVVAGSTTTPPTVTATVEATGSVTDPLPPPTTIDPFGAFSLADLPAPADYKLTFTAPGYLPTVTPVRVGAGQQVVLTRVRLDAGRGTIGGSVTDGTSPLGGVTIEASSGGLTVKSATPTVGTVGQFSIPDLPTPGSYLLTFTKEGFGTQTIDVALGPGESRTDLSVDLGSGTGTVSGTVTDPTGRGVGDATVTVNGGTNALVTKTISSGGRAGFYTVTGLKAPGRYTATVTAPGFTSTTIQIVLGSTGAATDQNITLQPSGGVLRGTILAQTATGTAGVGGVDVSVTDGATVYTTTTVSSPAGSYLLPGLPAGTYTVTFSSAGLLQQSYLVVVVAGRETIQDATLLQAGP